MVSKPAHCASINGLTYMALSTRALQRMHWYIGARVMVRCLHDEVVARQRAQPGMHLCQERHERGDYRGDEAVNHLSLRPDD